MLRYGTAATLAWSEVVVLACALVASSLVTPSRVAADDADRASDANPAPGAAARGTAPDAQPEAAARADAPAVESASAERLIEDSYHEAFAALARGDRERARDLLAALVASAPSHPLAARARALLDSLQAQAEMRVAEPLPSAASSEAAARPTSAARAELVFFQTLHGIALGAEVCAMALCDTTQPWVASLMVGAGAGFGLSFYLSRDGVAPGLSRALTDGTLWGAANGLGLLFATGAIDNSRHESATVGAFLALGQLGGLAIGGALGVYLQPSAGQVSLATSGGLWAVAAGAEFIGMFEPSFGGRTWAGLLLGIGNAGVLGGAFLARAEPMTASRVLLIDAGGVLGSLAGLGLAVLVQGRDPKATPTLAAGLAGTLTGVGLGYYLTERWDETARSEANAPVLSFAPVPGGVLAQLRGKF